MINDYADGQATGLDFYLTPGYSYGNEKPDFNLDNNDHDEDDEVPEFTTEEEQAGMDEFSEAPLVYIPDCYYGNDIYAQGKDQGVLS